MLLCLQAGSGDGHQPAADDSYDFSTSADSMTKPSKSTMNGV